MFIFKNFKFKHSNLYGVQEPKRRSKLTANFTLKYSTLYGMKMKNFLFYFINFSVVVPPPPSCPAPAAPSRLSQNPPPTSIIKRNVLSNSLVDINDPGMFILYI